jgi:hypothetical protein
MNNTEHFKKHGCVFIQNLFGKEMVRLLSYYFENKIRRGEWKESYGGDGHTCCFKYYGDPFTEVLLQDTNSAIEDITGRELIPTYSFVRVYQPGEQLKPHLDRPACEISVTVNVATKGNISPVYTRYGNNETQKHVLNPGDAVVYLGCDVLHWRHPLENDQINVQFMLHYVDKNGPNAKYAKDERNMYGLGPNMRSK